MKGVLHYVMCGADNESYWVPDLKSEKFCCSMCGSKLSREVENPNFYLKKKNYDISSTYDGFMIGSEKFVSLMAEIDKDGIAIFRIPYDPRYKTDFFHIELTKVLKLDCRRSTPEFGKICGKCGQYEYVVGACGYFLESAPCIIRGIFRTDIEFANGFEKSPIIIVGIESAQKLLGAKLKGMELEPVYG